MSTSRGGVLIALPDLAAKVGAAADDTGKSLTLLNLSVTKITLLKTRVNCTTPAAAADGPYRRTE